MPRNNNNKRNVRRNKRRGPNRARGRNQNMITTRPTIPRNLHGASPFPESRIVRLTAIHTYSLAAAATFVVHDFRANSLYQFDISGGTTNDFSGTTQLAAIYDSYHVTKIKVSFSLSGNESGQSVYFGLTFKDDQPSTTITNQTHAINALEVSPTTGPVVVGQTTGMEIFRSKVYNINCGSIVGNPLSYASDISYTATFGTNPNQNVWMSAVAYSVGGNMTNGVIVLMRTELTVRVYSLKTLQE